MLQYDERVYSVFEKCFDRKVSAAAATKTAPKGGGQESIVVIKAKVSGSNEAVNEEEEIKSVNVRVVEHVLKYGNQYYGVVTSSAQECTAKLGHLETT